MEIHPFTNQQRSVGVVAAATSEVSLPPCTSLFDQRIRE